MTKILQIAVREFVTTVFTKGFIIGLLILPLMLVIGFLVVPRLFGDADFSVEGQVAIVDATDQVTPELRAALTEGTPAASIADILRERRVEAVGGGNIAEALGMRPKLTVVERPADADVEVEKSWLGIAEPKLPHLALAVIHDNAIEPRPGETNFGSYDLYVPPSQDQRVEIAVHEALREAIISVRTRAAGFDRTELNDLVTVPRVRSVTVSSEGERATIGGINIVLPMSFMILLLMSVLGSGQGLLTTMIEEKSSRVIEVLLSAVSPMQLMAGKLIGHIAISLVVMSLYLGLGALALTSFSLFGLLEPMMIVYLFVFFILAFFTIGSIMMAVGSACNELREAQSFMTPIMLIMALPWFIMMPVLRNPDSTLAHVVSFLPPINSFGMILRIGSIQPPPVWQVLASIAIGIVALIGAVWVTAKIFRIGLLMFGKPPDFRTLVRWVRDA